MGKVKKCICFCNIIISFACNYLLAKQC